VAELLGHAPAPARSWRRPPRAPPAPADCRVSPPPPLPLPITLACPPCECSHTPRCGGTPADCQPVGSPTICGAVALLVPTGRRAVSTPSVFLDTRFPCFFLFVCTAGASNDGSFGHSETRAAMIVKRPYLKRHEENTSSTSSICFSHESDTTRHTPLVGFSSLWSMLYPLKSLRTHAILITVSASVMALRCPHRQPPRPTSRRLSVPGRPAGQRAPHRV